MQRGEGKTIYDVAERNSNVSLRRNLEKISERFLFKKADPAYRG